MSSFLYVLAACCFGYLSGSYFLDYADKVAMRFLEEPVHKKSPVLKTFLCWFTALFFGFVVFVFSMHLYSLFVMITSLFLIGCFFTDYQYGLLPDELTLSLVWLGLSASLLPAIAHPDQAILGALFGYGFFWFSNQVFRFFKGNEGMYPGDFKLNAGIGACVGLNFLIPILALTFLLLLMSVSLRFVLSKKFRKMRFLEIEIPYGCYASIAMILCFIRNFYQLYSLA